MSVQGFNRSNSFQTPLPNHPKLKKSNNYISSLLIQVHVRIPTFNLSITQANEVEKKEKHPKEKYNQNIRLFFVVFASASKTEVARSYGR